MKLTTVHQATGNFSSPGLKVQQTVKLLKLYWYKLWFQLDFMFRVCIKVPQYCLVSFISAPVLLCPSVFLWKWIYIKDWIKGMVRLFKHCCFRRGWVGWTVSSYREQNNGIRQFNIAALCLNVWGEFILFAWNTRIHDMDTDMGMEKTGTLGK